MYKMVWNIPNILSIFRVALIPFMVWGIISNIQWLFLVALILSGLSDAVDGFFARKYNQITDIGKILDPAADKLTQFAILLTLCFVFPEIIPLFFVFLLKDVCQLIGGIVLTVQKKKIPPSLWFGKLSTALFYLTVFALFLFPNLPAGVHLTCIILTIASMIFSFVGYVMLYYRLEKKQKNTLKTEDAPIVEENKITTEDAAALRTAVEETKV